MLLWMLFEFDVMYSAPAKMHTWVNITINVVCVTIVVREKKEKKKYFKNKYEKRNIIDIDRPNCSGSIKN